MECLGCGSIHEVVCSYSQLQKSKVPGPFEVPQYEGPCPNCSLDFADEVYGAWTRQVQTFPIGQERNFIHSQHSGMYGKFHPGFGCVVNDYGHKQQLLRQYDLREAADKIDGAPAGWGDSDEGTNYDLNRPEEVKAAAKAENDRKQKALDSIQWS